MNRERCESVTTMFYILNKCVETKLTMEDILDHQCCLAEKHKLVVENLNYIIEKIGQWNKETLNE